jgi:hypothetical protein
MILRVPTLLAMFFNVRMVVGLFKGSRSHSRTGRSSSSGSRRCGVWTSSALCARAPANDVSLDTNLLANNPDLVLSHLTSRRSSTELMESVSKIAALRTERNALIVQGDAAKNTRKTLSAQIGQLMKEGKTAEVDELKRQVEKANDVSAAADEAQGHIDRQIDAIFSVLPNLLDDR